MAEFAMEIAGHTGLVRSLFDSTRDYCGRYLSEKKPEFAVTVRREDLEFEQEALRREAEEEGFRFRRFTDPFLDRAAVQRGFAEFLFDRDVLMLHGSVVAVDGEGYLFAARSGTGKSTHTRLWCRLLGQRAVMVNDDKPFVMVGEEILVCGAPWSGKHGLDANVAVPLKGICLLERGTENRIRRAEPEEVLPMLMHQGYRPLEPEKEGRFAELVQRLGRRVPLWRMQCNKEPEAAATAYEAMRGG